MATVRFFAAAAEAAGTTQAQISGDTVGEIGAAIGDLYGAEMTRVLSRCSILVSGARSASGDDAVLPDDTVDVLPPFAGG